MISNLNLFELEKLRTELIDKSFNSSSNLNKLFLFVNYFEIILSLNKPNLIEAFLKEFIEDFISSIKKFDVWGADPLFTESLIGILEKLSDLTCFETEKPALLNENTRIKNLCDKLLDTLDGRENKDGVEQRAFFPLIDKETTENIYGVIDSITVRISKCTENNKFIIVPSEKDLEKKIAEQVNISWQLALALSKKYLKKTFQIHEVIISFDKRIGFYEGNSLGIALTLSFLEQLLKFYNPVYVINIKEHSAFTGGVDDDGKILTTGEEIIKQKVKAVFFSEIKNFVIPKFDETYAYFALTQLQKDYPRRKLKLIPVEDLNDVVNRRDLIDIKKQKLVVRSGKFVKKNWISAVATVLLAILFAYLFVVDFDDNPAAVSADGQYIFVKNKNGKLLWKRYFKLNVVSLNTENYFSKFCKLMDTNSDGTSEVLIANEQVGNPNELNTVCLLKCFDKNQKLLWQFSFNEKANSLRENLDTAYSIYMIDTLVIKNRKSLYVYANNGTSFGSAIFAIDLSTRKINTGVLWCSGHTYDGIIRDINGDNKKDILCMGLDNGFDDVMLFGFEPFTNNFSRPSTNEYQIKDYPIANFINLIRIPKTDYDFAVQNRFQSIIMGTLKYLSSSNEYSFSLDSDEGNSFVGILYKLNHNLKDFNVSVDNQYRVKRDALLNKGILDLPYSNTKEFEQIIRNSILYWDGTDWAGRENIIIK
ncbi:MAG: hypothetical protein WAR59_06985 [Ignavibacteriaceae bacterium]